ncbi:MAG: ArsR family transcriptional regulator [Candidatus Margulisiibacteriota bacterium]|nr:MAG: hypothetical protein A2X43_07775 [Candidatus Margulisbacteria bacterium GWD2_39_127]OGI03879.1 MAG: hypothetical protein A2X42_09960 [Candidatus Margulisbacteria bacterium GWF2_38_17]OGI08816.1 MAG: hypothetical protein A2X41_05155 [Candidatus Margulisbacteria bacterium GWE2_39_32]PZM78647.1 MAG: ArsR family transcriptional regulator [Candidatus Margulisiibacteriota bacterium]HAR61989.1 transcriptional regulator [Candidatus Margulisiibacteriota bacterium]
MEKELKPYIHFLRALASEERLSIIKSLLEKEMCVTEVENSFYMEQSTASHHLNLLKKAGIACSRRNGKQMIYSIDKSSFRTKYEEFLQLLSV